MRLTNEEVAAIKDVTFDFDKDAKIILFGSRTDDKKKGGDIDLLVLSKKASLGKKLQLLVGIKTLIGERKIDLLLKRNLDSSFAQLAYQTGIEL
ncbi:MAG: nucleotidyltransferase domain-containing protein [Draconibacterium sp.]|nr:nucleotidyltransferase domain-containing protein [Draconibacterium sp.]